MTFLRSALFMGWFVLLTAVMGMLCLPLLILPRKATVAMAKAWARGTLWGLKFFAGTGMRLRGRPPEGAMLVAAKHMSMWDTLALYVALDDPGIVLKRELLHVPFFGWYVWKAAAIPIDRGAGAEALRGMLARAKAVAAAGRPVLIFPEGTRKKPGAPPDYKPGVAGLYGALKIPCLPVALDSGRYWRGFTKEPGIISLEFLEPIAPGLKREAFMTQLECQIEEATNRLLRRA